LRERATPTAPVPGPDDLLARVPPTVVTELEKVRSDSSAGAEVLLRRLASDTESPVELVNQLVNDPPEWLVGSTSACLWAVVGEYAAAYDAREATARAFVHAAEKDDAEAPHWLARAALAIAGDDQINRAKELISEARDFAVGSHPFVEVIEAAIDVADSEVSSRSARVLEAAQAYDGDDPLVEMIRGRALLMLKRTADALAVYEAALERYPTNTAAALGLAETLFARCAMDESDSIIRDLNRAQELALQARDRRRAWRGKSSEAAALAAQVALYAGDLDRVLRITLPPPDGEAVEDEVENADVLSQAARAVLFKGDTHLALDLAEKISKESERQLALADTFRHIPDSSDLAQKAYERALEVAEDESQRLRAYFGLAKLGNWPIEGVEHLAEHDPELPDIIAAEADLARGDTAAAIKRYRAWKQSPRALEGLVSVYLATNQVEEAVEALRDGANRHRNPELRVRAARVLVSAKRYEDAEAEARRAMDAVPGGTHQHRELRKLRVQLTAWLDTWPEVEEHARAGLDEGIDILDMRWALVVARYNQRRPEDALSEMMRDPALEPRDELEAGLAIQLYRLGSRTPEDVRKVLDLADRFSASEQVSAAAFMAAIEMSSDTELTASLPGQAPDFAERLLRALPREHLYSPIPGR
jgi:tetratricopeptide (TPR) repeat protein